MLPTSLDSWEYSVAVCDFELMDKLLIMTTCQYIVWLSENTAASIFSREVINNVATVTVEMN